MERLGAVAGTFKMKEAELSADEKMAYRDHDQSEDFNVDEEDQVRDEDDDDGVTIHFIQTETDDWLS